MGLRQREWQRKLRLRWAGPRHCALAEAPSDFSPCEDLGGDAVFLLCLQLFPEPPAQQDSSLKRWTQALQPVIDVEDSPVRERARQTEQGSWNLGN